MKEHQHYFDCAATTPLGAEALAAMLPYFTNAFGNASSIYQLGREAKKALEASRQTIAHCLEARPEEIFFTSGGTEADNWAIFGSAMKHRGKKNKMIVSEIEHHAVLHPAQKLAKEGLEVVYLPVDEMGMVQPETLKSVIDEQTFLVSVMMANNEVGTIQPITELARISHEAGAWFHTDAVQAVGHIPVNVQSLGIDLLSLSGHKFNGPKGVGALYIRKGLGLPAWMEGGAQERNRRAGTENIAGIVGMAKALEGATYRLEESQARLTSYREQLIQGLLERITETKLNGHPVHRLPGNVNLSFAGIEGEGLLLKLDQKGIAASSGSACTSGALDPSHVLMAMGVPHEIAHGSLRLSMGEQTSQAQVDYVLETVPAVVEQLRSMSPLWEKK